MLSYLPASGLGETVNPHTISPTRRNNQHAMAPTLHSLFTYLEKEEAAIPENTTKYIWEALNRFFGDT